MSMKKTIITALVLSFLGGSSAWGADKWLGDGGDNWLEHVREQEPTTMIPVNQTPALFGSPARVESASRRVTLTPEIRTLRVASGETVAFRAGNRTVGWTFLEAIGGTSVDMSFIFPSLPEAKGILVIIEPSTLFGGG
ncbi:CzcE family metal-binding protein [Cupriavidus necator]